MILSENLKLPYNPGYFLRKGRLKDGPRYVELVEYIEDFNDAILITGTAAGASLAPGADSVAKISNSLKKIAQEEIMHIFVGVEAYYTAPLAVNTSGRWCNPWQGGQLTTEPESGIVYFDFAQNPTRLPPNAPGKTGVAGRRGLDAWNSPIGELWRQFSMWIEYEDTEGSDLNWYFYNPTENTLNINQRLQIWGWRYEKKVTLQKPDKFVTVAQYNPNLKVR